MKNSLASALILIFSVIDSHVGAQETSSGSWTPQYSFSLKQITDTQISPDARYIAYVVREACMTDTKSEYVSQIYVTATDHSFDRQFTYGDKSCSSPQFSPDGKKLAFLSSRNGSEQIFEMWLEGGEAKQISNAPASISFFRWSPDGSKIAYLMQDPENEDDKKRKSEKTDIVVAGKNYKYRHIYVCPSNPAEASDCKAMQITSGEMYINEFDWSPDATQIVFSFQADPEINTGFMNSDISIVPSDSGEIRMIINQPGTDTDPLFSPNGKQIAYCSQGGLAEAIGFRDLYVISISGGKAERLSLTPDRNVSLVGWSPDGKLLYASESLGTSRHLLALKVKGNEVSVVTLDNRPLSDDIYGKTPSGSTGTYGKFSIASNLWALSFTWQEFGKPEEVFYSELINYRPQQVSSLNDLQHFPPVSPTELISWESPDGTIIEGLLTYPSGYQGGKKYPLILNIHGGPAGVFTQYFTGIPTLYQIQDMAREGYAVLRPNPRGSSGYGKDFRYANVRDWGNGDFEDVMAGVDKVIDMGIADKDQLYVAGWSYGGYLTSFIVTKTDRFLAASMGAGLPDLVSMVYTTDIPDYLVAHMGHELWNDYDVYMEHSAMFHLNNIHTPLQILHGQNDHRVPLSQSEELYNALKRKNIPTEMIMYPRSGHSPSEPKLLMDVTPRVLKWFQSFEPSSGGNTKKQK